MDGRRRVGTRASAGGGECRARAVAAGSHPPRILLLLSLWPKSFPGHPKTRRQFGGPSQALSGNTCRAAVTMAEKS